MFAFQEIYQHFGEYHYFYVLAPTLEKGPRQALPYLAVGRILAATSAYVTHQIQPQLILGALLSRVQ